jgi:hypothetical protein
MLWPVLIAWYAMKRLVTYETQYLRDCKIRFCRKKLFLGWRKPILYSEADIDCFLVSPILNPIKKRIKVKRKKNWLACTYLCWINFSSVFSKSLQWYRTIQLYFVLQNNLFYAIEFTDRSCKIISEFMHICKVIIALVFKKTAYIFADKVAK